MGLAVVALGARTPIGMDAASTAAAYRAGVSKVREFPFVDMRGELLLVASDAELGPRVEGVERMVVMAGSALREVAEVLVPRLSSRCSVELWVAVPEWGAELRAEEEKRLVDALAEDESLRAMGAEKKIRVVGRGHAGVAQGVELAQREEGRFPNRIVVMLGVDSMVQGEVLIELENQKRIGSEVRHALFPGEGAGVLVLAPESVCGRMRLPVLARVLGIGIAVESLLRGSETGSFGEGMTAAVLGATDGLRLPNEAVDRVYADLNGERYRSEEWGFVGLRAAERFREFEYEAPADRWGDVGAASGALAGVLAVAGWVRGYESGERVMVMTGSDGGTRGCFLLVAGDRDAYVGVGL